MKNNYSEKNKDCRVLAAEVVAAIIKNQASCATLLPAALDRVQYKDRALLQELCYGTLRYYYSLRARVDMHLDKPLKEKDSDILSVILIGAYQLLHTRIPAYAAINSSVNAANVFKKLWAKALINAVLRNIQREVDKKENQMQHDSLLTSINDEARYDHPQWLIDTLKKDHPDQVESILNANNSKAPMTLRVNEEQIKRSDYLALLEKGAISAKLTVLSRYGIQLESAVDVSTLPLFSDGAVSVQDEAAQLSAPLLRLSKNLCVLDACAAPGGKTGHMLEIEPSLDLTALDINEQRNNLIQENLRRLKVFANVITGDATEPHQWWKQHCNEKYFDAILLDAPCSATGVIRHHPDIKLLRKANDIPVLAKTQLQLLTTLWPLLKPNGILLYITCSILNQESDDVMSEFLKKTADAKVDKIDESWGVSTAYGRQLLPQLNGHDGFYYSRIKKHSTTQK